VVPAEAPAPLAKGGRDKARLRCAIGTAGTGPFITVAFISGAVILETDTRAPPPRRPCRCRSARLRAPQAPGAPVRSRS